MVFISNLPRRFLHEDLGLESPQPTFFQVSSVLRLAHKYNCVDLRTIALHRLSRGFPVDLNGVTSVVGGAIRDSMFPDNIFRLIPLCLEVNALWLLPFAFHLLAKSPTDHEETIFIRWIASPDIFLRAFRGFRRQALWGAEFTSCFSLPSTPCSRKPFEGCAQVQLSIMAGFVSSILNQETPLGIHPITQSLWAAMANTLCPECVAALRQKIEGFSSSYWDALPAMYGLPAWDELKKMRGEALGLDSPPT